MSDQPGHIRRRHHNGSVAAAEAARSEHAALRLPTSQSIVDHHGTRHILKRIMAKTPLHSLIKFGMVHARKRTAPSFNDASFERFQTIVDSGWLVFEPDDKSQGSMSFLAGVMFEKQMPLTALQVCFSHYRYSFSVILCTLFHSFTSTNCMMCRRIRMWLNAAAICQHC